MKAPLILSDHQQDTIKESLLESLDFRLRQLPVPRLMGVYRAISEFMDPTPPVNVHIPRLRLVPVDRNLDKSEEL